MLRFNHRGSLSLISLLRTLLHPLLGEDRSKKEAALASSVPSGHSCLSRSRFFF